MYIVDLLRELARQNTRLNAFYYGAAQEKGFGKELHPLMWVDDPFQGNADGPTLNVLQTSVNVDILGIPKDDKDNRDIERIQAAAFATGLDVLEKLRKLEDETRFEVLTWSYITLRNYYDNKAAGIRFTITFQAPNPADLCGDPFDPDKQFPERNNPFPVFEVDGATGCAVFNDGKTFPDFTTEPKPASEGDLWGWDSAYIIEE